jgi:hypothetical protein
MFNRLGIAGACSLLGGLNTILCVIPFVFIWKGEAIRANSRFCTALKQQKDAMEHTIDGQGVVVRDADPRETGETAIVSGGGLKENV